MKTYAALPNAEVLRRDVLETTLRPAPHVPSVVTRGYDNGCTLALNAAGLTPGWRAAAVFFEPPRHNPHRSPRPGRLVLVVAVQKLGPPGRPWEREVEWYEGLVGEVAPPAEEPGPDVTP